MIVTDNGIFNPNVPDLPTKDQVQQLCRQKGSQYNRLKYTANGSNFFIKYNNATMAEAHAQLFFHSQIKQSPHANIHIPEIYHSWLADHGASAYIVMEYIDIDHFASDEERACVITEMISVKPPAGLFGSFGSLSLIRHPFFRDHEANKIYSSVRELEDSINGVCEFSMQSKLI